MAPRPVYHHVVLERHLDVARERVWDALLELLDAGSGGYDTPGDPPPHGAGAIKRFRLDDLDLTEETISLEAPWRRVYQIVAGAPVVFYQGSTVIVPEGDGCILMWAALIEPLPDDGSDAYIERVELALTNAVDRIVALATG